MVTDQWTEGAGRNNGTRLPGGLDRDPDFIEGNFDSRGRPSGDELISSDRSDHQEVSRQELLLAVVFGRLGRAAILNAESDDRIELSGGTGPDHAQARTLETEELHGPEHPSFDPGRVGRFLTQQIDLPWHGSAPVGIVNGVSSRFGDDIASIDQQSHVSESPSRLKTPLRKTLPATPLERSASAGHQHAPDYRYVSDIRFSGPGARRRWSACRVRPGMSR